MATTNSNPEIAADSVSTTPDPLINPVQVAASPTIDGSTPIVAATSTASEPAAAEPTTGEPGIGIDGEQTVWEGSYSLRNFAGRITWRVLLTLGLVALAVNTWGYNNEDMLPMTVIVGLLTIAAWIHLVYRMAGARYGRAYRLTNRRLFVESGVMRRRSDQMELVQVKDVFVRQTLLERWRGLGTVVVVPAERELPTFYLMGVDNPHVVMDLVWHHARNEREFRKR